MGRMVLVRVPRHSRKIFFDMLHLYGTRGDNKIWSDNNFRACKEVPRAQVQKFPPLPGSGRGKKVAQNRTLGA